jgi:hypothetical protein
MFQCVAFMNLGSTIPILHLYHNRSCLEEYGRSFKLLAGGTGPWKLDINIVIHCNKYFCGPEHKTSSRLAAGLKAKLPSMKISGVHTNLTLVSLRVRQENYFTVESSNINVTRKDDMLYPSISRIRQFRRAVLRIR